MIGYIYMLGSPLFGWYKIGKSKEPNVRVKTLGILLPFKIEVVGIWRAENYDELERKLHRAYADRKINGEWFFFQKFQLQDFFADMAKFASVSTLESFSNIERESAPDGRELTVRFRKSMPASERERRAKESQAARKLRQSLRSKCDACGQPIKVPVTRTVDGADSIEKSGNVPIQ